VFLVKEYENLAYNEHVALSHLLSAGHGLALGYTCCHIKRVQRSAISTGALYSRCKSQRRNGNSDNKVLTIALCYTAVSIFRTGDSLTPFRDSISVFQCRSVRLTTSRSFGYLS